MSTGVLKALPGKLDIKRLSPSILYLLPPRRLVRMYDEVLNVLSIFFAVTSLRKREVIALVEVHACCRMVLDRFLMVLLVAIHTYFSILSARFC